MLMLVLMLFLLFHIFCFCVIVDATSTAASLSVVVDCIGVWVSDALDDDTIAVLPSINDGGGNGDDAFVVDVDDNDNGGKEDDSSFPFDNNGFVDVIVVDGNNCVCYWIVKVGKLIVESICLTFD
jgi:hypothetical protein